MKLAVIGKDVSKSLSPRMHGFIMEKLGMVGSYEKVSVPETEFEREIPKLLKEYDGLNVTIPYKEKIIPYLRETRGDGALFASVNTVKMDELVGYNTDGVGFMMMLDTHGVEVKDKRILVLGVGGSGRTVVQKLASVSKNMFAYNRTFEKAETLYKEFPFFTPLKTLSGKYDIIVNCTGIGMHQTVGISPVGEEVLAQCEVAVDLIYEPKKSEFLRLAESLGKKTVNGESMLFYQAYFADCIYFGLTPDRLTAEKLFKEYQAL